MRKQFSIAFIVRDPLPSGTARIVTVGAQSVTLY